MKAIVLCAGRGERLRPLTDQIPKPLIEVGGEALLGRHLARLAQAGFEQAVVNAAHLSEQIVDYVGDGSRWDLRVKLSLEGETALETGGGMLHALPWLGPKPFLAINGDIWTDFDFASLPKTISGLAHLLLVPNPPHNPAGDFGLHGDTLSNQPKQLTFSGIGIYDPKLLAGQSAGKFSITPLLRSAIEQSQISGQQFDGRWFDIGSLARLDAARTAVE